MGDVKTSQTPPIIVVTGANGGVGFGICHRLLVQLSEPNPPDARPRFTSLLSNHKDDQQLHGYDASAGGVTIILACRNLDRAAQARAELYKLLDAHIAQIPKGTYAYDYATRFRRKAQLEVHVLDLSEVRSVFAFGKEISQKYQYISHLICNAGVAKYSHLDYLIFFRQCLVSPTLAVRHPAFNVQKVGVLSGDGLGFVWESNVFGHYILFRSIQNMLSRYAQYQQCAHLTPARVLWTTSVDALPTYDPKDWQLTKTDAPYQASKSQIDLMCMELARQRDPNLSGDAGQIAHLLVSPGITATKMAAELLRPVILEWLMLLFFYLCRFLGSPHVLFSTYKAAIAASHLSLAPLPYIPTSLDTGSSSEQTGFPKYSAENDRWGRENIGVEAVMPWTDYPDEHKQIIERCERLYQMFLKAEGKKQGNGTAQPRNGDVS